MCEIFFSPFILFHVMGLVLRRRNSTEKNTLLLFFAGHWALNVKHESIMIKSVAIRRCMGSGGRTEGGGAAYTRQALIKDSPSLSGRLSELFLN